MTLERPPTRHLIKACEYLRMTDVFDPEARLELIQGEIIEMAPIGSPHAGIVKILNRIFATRASGRGIVSVQHPLVTGEFSVPEPDIALLRPRADSYRDAYPTTADTLLVIEVADSSLAFDMKVKAPLYIEAGVPECWVIDVQNAQVRVFREGASFIVTGSASIAPLALPDVAVSLDELFR